MCGAAAASAASLARTAFAGLGTGSVTLEGAATRIATLTLRNPERRNSLDGAMMVDLAAAVDALERSATVTAVLLRGEGGFFCSGADLSFAREHLSTPEQGALMCSLMQDTCLRLWRLPCISCSLIEGGAVGGGTELSLATDFRVFASDASWRMVQAKMGVSPGWGGGARLVRLVGRKRALELLAGGRALDAEAALALGVADWSLAPPGETLAHATALLTSAGFLGGDTAAVRGCKAVVAAGDELDVHAATAREAEIFATLWGGSANRDAVAPPRT